MTISRLTRFSNESAHHLTAVPANRDNLSRVDCRNPAERAVDAVLAALAADAPARKRIAANPEQSHQPPGEIALWLAAIEDALNCADAIRQGRPLPATGTSPAAIGWSGNRRTVTHDPHGHNDYDRAAERRTLRKWIVGDYLGSLRWIADQLALSDDVVRRIRERIEPAVAMPTRTRAAA